MARTTRSSTSYGAATERIAAAAEAAAFDFPFTLTARAETSCAATRISMTPIARLRAFEEAGADVLYAPALLSAEEIKTVCDAVVRSRSTSLPSASWG